MRYSISVIVVSPHGNEHRTANTVLVLKVKYSLYLPSSESSSILILIELVLHRSTIVTIHTPLITGRNTISTTYMYSFLIYICILLDTYMYMYYSYT